MKNHLTQAQAEELIREWQETLRLQDWNVSIEIVRRYQMPDDESSSSGYCSRLPDMKVATILLLDPIDFKRPEFPGAMIDDMENTLVHELLHVYYCDLTTGVAGIDNKQLERVCEGMARVLVGLKRDRRTKR